MLKIKDNVDLKELEKFGFIELGTGKTDTTFGNWVKWWFPAYENDEYDCITIFDDRSIHLGLDVQTGPSVDTLYDLIKADLVEKVDE